MTEIQKRCQELLPVIQAGAEGKVIEASLVPGEAMFPWQEVEKACVAHVFGPYKFRVKPEPKYRPFTPEEALARCGKVVKSKEESTRMAKIAAVGIVYGNEQRVWLSGGKERDLPETHSTTEWLFERFTFADGTPCGVLTSD